MTRRIFIHKMITWIKAASALTLLGGKAKAMASEADPPVVHGVPGMSLRELSVCKLHHGEGRFINPFEPPQHGNFWRLLRWKLFSENHYKSDYPQEPVQRVVVDWDAVERHKGLSVTFLKHASVLIRDADRFLIMDPVLFDLFWFIKDFSPLAFPVDRMPHPHCALITHGHYDHLDLPSLRALGPGTQIISPLGYDGLLSEGGLGTRHSLDWFDTFEDKGLRITLLPANHWTMRNPFEGPNRALWGSYLVQTRTGPTIFLSGDTAYYQGFREIGETFDIDLAVLCLGAYEPRWFMKTSHMNPEQTVQAFQDLRAKRLVIVHWGTFRLGDEPVHFPPLHLKQRLEERGMLEQWIPLRHGGTLFYNHRGEPSFTRPA